MACPMGYTSNLNEKDPLPPPEKTPIFPTITEPDELKKVGTEFIYLLGSQYAILCQFAHPRLAHGTVDNSDFASRILNRLKTTSRFLNAAVYGTEKEKEAIFGQIHRRHALVKKDRAEAGAGDGLEEGGYDADDPELHMWTAATLFMSLVVVEENFMGKMERGRMEKLFKESAIYGTSLRMPPEMWPATLDEFFEYWNRNIETLEVTDWARELSKGLLYPKGLPLWLKPVSPMSRLVSINLLPEKLRREYGFEVTPRKKRVYHGIVRSIKLVYPRVPKRLRTLPSKFYMKDMKKAVELIERTGNWVE